MKNEKWKMKKKMNYTKLNSLLTNLGKPNYLSMCIICKEVWVCCRTPHSLIMSVVAVSTSPMALGNNL